MAKPAICGIAIDHGVHIAGRDAKVQIGLTQLTEGLFMAPIWLGQDPYPIALRL